MCLNLELNHTHVENPTGNSWEKFINYSSSARNRTHAFAMPVQCSCHWATEVADKSKRDKRDYFYNVAVYNPLSILVRSFPLYIFLYLLVFKEFLQGWHQCDLGDNPLHWCCWRKVGRNHINIAGDFDILWYFLGHFIKEESVVHVIDIVYRHVNLQCFLA